MIIALVLAVDLEQRRRNTLALALLLCESSSVIFTLIAALRSDIDRKCFHTAKRSG